MPVEDYNYKPALQGAIGTTALGAGTYGIRKGIDNLILNDKITDAVDHTLERLRTFNAANAPTGLGEAANRYKEITNIGEMASRNFDDVVNSSKTIRNVMGAPDSLRQNIVRGLSEGLMPNAKLDPDVVGDTTKDVINRLRNLGLRDFDQATLLKNHYGAIQNRGKDLYNTLSHLKTSELPKLTKYLKFKGRGLAGLGLTGVGLGATLLTDAFTKQSSELGVEDIAAGALVPGAGYMGVTGLKDIIAPNKDILVTYGTDDSLGAGHSTPGRNIISSLKSDPRFANANIVDAPMSQGLYQTQNAPALKGKYALGIDTGWGLFSEKGGREWGQRGFIGGPADTADNVKLDHVLFKQRAVSGNNLLKNMNRILEFHPDAPSTSDYYSPYGFTKGRDYKGFGGFLRRNFTNMGKFHNVTYGDKNLYKGNNLAFSGAAHPAVELSTDAALDPKAYRQLVAEELATSNPGTTADDWLKKIGDKKIISLSGASRGDAVGARYNIFQKALKERNALDKYFVLGLGGKAKDYNALIGSGGTGDLGSGGMVGFTKKFAPLAQNADLHSMGMGGATPYEMMTHAGQAPIVRSLDDELAGHIYRGGDKSPEAIKKYLDSGNLGEQHFFRTKGLAGVEGNIARNLIDSGAIKDPAILEQLHGATNKGLRDWMAPTGLYDTQDRLLAPGGSHKRLKTGLDGIVDYMNSKGVHSSNVSDTASVNKLIDALESGNLKGIPDDIKNVIRGEVTASKAGLIDNIYKNWKGARNLQRFKGAGKLGVAAALASPLVYLATADRSPKFSAFDRILTKKADDASLRDYMQVGMGAAGTGAGLGLATGGIGAQAAGAGLQRVGDAAGLMDMWHDPMASAQMMDAYGTASQRAMKARPLGIPTTTIAKYLPIGEVVGPHIRNPIAFGAHLATQAGFKDPVEKFLKNKSPKTQESYTRLQQGSKHYLDTANLGTKNFSREFVDELLDNGHRVSGNDVIKDWAPFKGWTGNSNYLSQADIDELYKTNSVEEAYKLLAQKNKALYARAVADGASADTLHKLKELQHGDRAKWFSGFFANRFFRHHKAPLNYGSLLKTVGKVTTPVGTLLAGAGAAAMGLGLKDIIQKSKSDSVADIISNRIA